MRRAIARQLYRGVLPSWKVDLILERARKKGFFENQMEDMLQELALFVADFRYDPERANGAPEAAVLSTVLDLKLLAMRRAAARVNRQRDDYRNDLGADRADGAPLAPDPTVAASIVLDVRMVLAELTRRERMICHALMRGITRDEIANTLKIKAFKLELILAAIRKRFELAGLALEGSRHD